jgi:hypothetical protein
MYLDFFKEGSLEYYDGYSSEMLTNKMNRWFKKFNDGMNKKQQEHTSCLQIATR